MMIILCILLYYSIRVDGVVVMQFINFSDFFKIFIWNFMHFFFVDLLYTDVQDSNKGRQFAT